MAYLIDDSWDNCGPVIRVGNAAWGVYVRCGTWVARNLTDGFVPAELAAAYGSPEYTRKLVDAGLWEAVDGGYRVVGYFPLNKTRDRVLAEREAARKRQAARRARDGTRDFDVSHGVTDGVTSRSLTPPKGGRARARDAPPTIPLKRHAFTDDGNGSCTGCGLLRQNKIHPAA